MGCIGRWWWTQQTSQASGTGPTLTCTGVWTTGRTSRCHQLLKIVQVDPSQAGVCMLQGIFCQTQAVLEPHCHSSINGGDGIEASVLWLPWPLSAIKCTLCHSYGAFDYRAAASLLCLWQARSILPVTKQRCPSSGVSALTVCDCRAGCKP